MATLTDTAKVTRNAFKLGTALLVFLIIGRFFLTWSINLYQSLVPDPPPEATVGFNVLPQIQFQESAVTDLTYSLETVNGSVPSFGVNGQVFYITKPQTSILGLDRGKQKAMALGFVFEPKQIAGTLYRWNNTTPLPATLDLDYTLEDFVMKVTWESSPQLLTEVLIPNEVQAVSESKSYIKRAGFLPADMQDGRTIVTYLKYLGGELTEAISLSEAEFVEVDIFRENIGDFKVLPANPDKGLAHLLISGSRNQGERILLAEFKHTQVMYELMETYPLITGPEAWQKLVAGAGYIAKAPSGDTAVIRRISMAYYDSLDEQQYLQPIYVFEGDDDFTAYVSAIRDEWVSQ